MITYGDFFRVSEHPRVFWFLENVVGVTQGRSQYHHVLCPCHIFVRFLDGAVDLVTNRRQGRSQGFVPDRATFFEHRFSQGKQITIKKQQRGVMFFLE